MYSTTISKEVDIDVPITEVFDFLVQPEKIPLILQGLIENTNIPDLPLEEGDQFNFKYAMYGVTLEGIWKVTKLDSPNTYHAKTEGEVDSRWEYDLAEKNGGTHVTLKVHYDTPDTVLQKIKADAMKQINKKEAETLLDNLKTICEMHG